MPFPKYAGYYPPGSYQNSHFTHFAGHSRYKNGIYTEKAKIIVGTI